MMNCVWVSGYDKLNETDVKVSVSQGENELFSVKSVSFCWDGNLLGITEDKLTAKDVNGVDTTIQVTVGPNDHLWKQCTLRQLALNIIVLAAIALVVICVALTLVLICGCIVWCSVRNAWERSQQSKRGVRI